MLNGNNEDDRGSEDPPKFLNETEVIKINGKEWYLPDQPIASFTRSRADDLRNDIDVSPDYGRYSSVEDVPVSIQDGRAQTENEIQKVIDAESTDADIFDQLGFKEVSDASKGIMVARHVISKKHLHKLDQETYLQLAELANEVADIYIMQPLIADDAGAISLESIENYLDIVEKLREETDSLTIVPVLHLSDAEGMAARKFANKVDEELATDDYPFIGISGNSPFSNKKSFLGVRQNSEKRLLVTQCPKKLTGSDLEGLRPISRSHFYMANEAKVVLDKKYLPGGNGDNDDDRLDLVQESYSVFEKESCDEASSAISDFVSFKGQREEIEESSSTKDFELLHNELAITEGVRDICERLDAEEPVFDDKEVLRDAVVRF